MRDKEERERRGSDSTTQQFSILNYVDKDDDGSSYKKRICHVILAVAIVTIDIRIECR